MEEYCTVIGLGNLFNDRQQWYEIAYILPRYTCFYINLLY